MSCEGTQTAARKLAQFFTPQAVAAFALDALMALGLRPGSLRLIDPACGEGVFLQDDDTMKEISFKGYEH